MRIWAAIAALALMVGLLFIMDLNDERHYCTAPCKVSFGPDMEEDSFDIDYHDGQLEVFRVVP
jgi:hypothetical protein